MPTVQETVAAILAAPTWDRRVARIRGRVFTLANLPEMLTVAPFSTLLEMAGLKLADEGESSDSE